MNGNPQKGSPTETLSGVIDRIIYQNEENHYCIAEVAIDKGGNRITVVGTLPAVQCGETIEMKGVWKSHKDYGNQFTVSEFQSRLPASVYGIRKYLGSGLIQGIGKTYAEKIVDKFGEDTLRVIQEDSGRLREVEGIGKKRALEIKTAWDTQHASREIMMFLQTYGVSVRQCVHLVQAYGNQAKAILMEDPYQVAREIDGIGFKTADQIAINLGFANESPQRLDAGLLHLIKEQEMNGHTGLERETIINTGAEMLQVHKDLLNPRLEILISKNDLILFPDSDFIQLPSLYRAEEKIESNLYRILNGSSGLPPIDIPRAIQWSEERCGFEFAPEQSLACDVALRSKFSILTGGPGTGKTTILRSLVQILDAKKVKIALASPTGRAAQRLSQSAQKPASTLHRLLKYDPNKGGFVHNEQNPLTCDFIILDEASMLDTWLAQSILRAVPLHAHVLFVGDVDQLPSVGCGNVLSDLIQSGKIPTVSLKKIFRQRETSNIVSTAHRILSGESAPPKLRQSISELDPRWDFQFLQANNPIDALNQVRELYQNWIPREFKITNPIKDIQVLAPIHKGSGGISNFNITLQKALNEKSPGIRQGEIFYSLNDKVIQLRNNYDKGIFNGDMGIITHVNTEAGTLAVNFDGRIIDLERGDLGDLTLAYAISIHKSQGSEFPVVIIPLLTQHFILLQRNLLYTAITRGRKKVIIVGDPKAYVMAVSNDKQQQRFTGLKLRLKDKSN